MTLDDTHRQYLVDHAITPATIERAGIYSDGAEIVFPWTDGDLRTLQRRPWPGQGGQYFWEKDADLHFWDLRDAGPTSPVLVIEGTKQSLAAVSHADPRWSVLGMAGCEGWNRCDLSRFQGRDVFIGLDADAGENLSVWEAGDLFRQELEFYEVRSVRFLHLPARGTQGLDDVLAKRQDAIRTRFLDHLAEKAQAKPAERKPTTRKGSKMETMLPDTGGRPGVAVNIDRKEVIDQITGALVEAHDGKSLFNFGEVITRVSGHETRPLDRDSFNATLVDTVACFHYTEPTGNKPAIFVPTWPDANTVGAVMSKADQFSPLRRVVRVPFLRPDGTVCYSQGYDRATGTVLVSEDLDDVQVPDEPTQEECRAAAKFLMEEWLGDLPFKTAADRANALAMALTPFMRGIVPLSPLGVVSGLQMGVGKNLLADCIAILATGRPADPLPWVQDDEEMRKMITSAFQSGAEMFVFDEAHVVQGAQLARAITSITYADRILGVTRIAKYPNLISWMSLGNQVQVNGDLARRVYFVYLHPTGRNVIDREASSFRHPDLKEWTTENRAALVSAALTVLRGWYAAGRPAYSRGATMGSFEPWDRMMSGALAYAGMPEFLTDVKERRSESDFATAWWTAHVHWLRDTFGSATFVVGQVRDAALRNPASAELPPDMEDPSGKDWTRALGRAYSSKAERDFDGMRLVKAGQGHKSTKKWCVVTDTDNPGDGIGQGGGDGGMGGDSPLYVHEKTPPTSHAHAYVEGEGETVTSDTSHTSTEPGSGSAVGFDIETASASQLYMGGHEGPFVRLVGAEGESVIAGGGASVGPNVEGLVDVLNGASALYGHGILDYDLPALARHHGADYDALAAKSIDTLVLARLLDPPGAKGMRPWSDKGYYGLDAVAKRRNHVGKTDDLQALAEKHGGYDRIPVDDPEYRAYLHGDLEATRFVYDRLTADGISDYALREMRVEALKSRMTLNGWAVDTDLLAERVAGEEARVQAAKDLLAGFGMPLNKPDKYRLKLKRDWPESVWGTPAAVLRERMAEDLEAAVREGFATVTPGEPYASPWATAQGREAIVKAFAEAGAAFVPRTPDGSLKTSGDAMGDGFWLDAEKKSRPGMLRAYEDHENFPAIKEIANAVVMATGATDKYAEIQRWTTAAGRVHAENSAPQASGRGATVHPATSNIGARGEAGEQRAVFVADPGHVLFTCDLSQVDMRAVAALSQDAGYMALFEPGRDAHMDMAEVFFGERTPEARQRTKAINHKLNYGGGVESTASMNRIPVEVVQQAYDARAEAFPRLMEWTREVRDLAATGALLDNGFGRMMRPDPERSWTQGPALMGQGCARDIMWESILRLVDRRPDVTPYLRGVVHDELILSVPEADVEEWQAIVKEAFTWEWRGVPILCEVSNAAHRWSECAH